METLNLVDCDNMDISFAELFNLNPSDYVDVTISNLGFKQAAIQKLKELNIFYLSDLLLLSSKELLKIRNIGKGRLNQILEFFSSLENGDIDISAYKISSIHDVPLTIALNREKIVEGDFSSVEISKNNKGIVSKYIVAQETIGQELASICMTKPNCVMPMIQALSNFYEIQSVIIHKREALTNLMNSISEERKNNRIYDYIELYPSTTNDKNVLKRIYRFNSSQLTSEEINEIIVNKDEYHIVIEFLRWLVISPKHYIMNILKIVLQHHTKKQIINMRIDGYSFSDISKAINLSKEQVIIKHNEVINGYFSDNNCLAALILFSLDMKNKKCFSEAELAKEFGEFVSDIKYIYSYSTNSRVYFDTISNQLILK